MFYDFQVCLLLLSFPITVACTLVDQLQQPSCCHAIASALPGKVFMSGQRQYTDSLLSYYSKQERDLAPFCIVRPGTTKDVSRAVNILSASYSDGAGPCKFAVKGGGHTPYAGSANIEAGVTLDLAALNNITVNKARDVTSVGPGARWGQVYTKLDGMQLSVIGGRASSVGVAGLSLGGGISFFSGRYGLACDNILNYEVVLADGRIENANDTHNVDLRNALRGGSNNFGIVTRFDFATFPQGKIWGGYISYDFSMLPQQLRAFFEFGNDAHYDEHSAMFQLFSHQDGVFAITVNPIYTKPTPDPPAFKAFVEMQPQLLNTARIAPLNELTNNTGSAGNIGLRNMFITTSFANDLAFLEWLAPAWQKFTLSTGNIQGVENTMLNQHIVPKMLRRSAGNSLGLDPSKTIVISLLTLTWKDAQDDARVMETARAFLRGVEKESKKRGVYNPFVYLNYSDQGQEVIDGYGAANKARLRHVSQKYDPQGIFQKAVPGGFKLW